MKGMYPTLIKREIWESRSLYLAPLIAAGVLVALWVWGALIVPTHFRFNFSTPPTPFPADASRMGIGLYGLTMQLFFVSSLVCGFYLLDCLYAERKDRSILFWKSLPVSDLQTVLSKFVVAMAVVPLGVFVLATVLYPLLFAIAAAGVPNFSYMSGGWNTGEWMRAEAAMLGALVATQLWYAPLAAWNMLASVVSRRSPALMAILPILVITIFEGMLFRTRHALVFVGRRLMPVPDLLEGLQRPSMWIGLAVTAGMLYIVVRLRRYRDDT
jgi:ABC-2 type transport system permease protein